MNAADNYQFETSRQDLAAGILKQAAGFGMFMLKPSSAGAGTSLSTWQRLISSGNLIDATISTFE